MLNPELIRVLPPTIWMRFGTRVSKTPCQNRNPWVQGLARCFAYACTKSHPNRSKFGGDIAQIGAHQFSLSSINFVINSTPQGPWERKDQKTHVTPYRCISISKLGQSQSQTRLGQDSSLEDQVAYFCL